jgi:enoyl-CoA hydratase/carnithine racemase
MTDDLRVARDGAVRTIVLDRAAKRNALTQAMLDGLEALFRTEPPPSERVTVLRSEGPVFSAGLDLRERAEGTEGESPIEAMLHAVESYPLPVVAVVQGDAIAGGNELALHCDLVIASTRAQFGMSLAQIGLAPTWFLAKKLLEVAGPVVAREILLLGDPVPATRLAELGVISRAVPPHELDAVAGAVVGRLAANAPLSLRAMKALLVREMAFRDGITHGDVDVLVDQARASQDAKEGVTARLERRAPRFEGR